MRASLRPSVRSASRRATASALGRLRARLPEATFFHRAGWQRILEDVFRHDTHYLYAERDGRIHGVLPLAHVKSCCSATRCVACRSRSTAASRPSDEEAADALEHEAQRSGQRCGVRAPRAAQRAARHARLAGAGPVRHLPQGHPARRRSQHAGHPAQAARDGAQGHQERACAARSTPASIASSRSTPTTCTATARRRCPSAISRRCARRSATTARCSPSARPTAAPCSSVLSFYFRDEVLPYYAGDDVAARDWPPTTSSTGS